jgi:hypothetical protein
MSLKIEIHGVGMVRCSLHRKKKTKTEGVLATVEGTTARKFLSFAALCELISLNGPPLAAEAEAVPVTSNGEEGDA